MRAAEKVLALGPKALVVKHGEYGATAFFSDRSFAGVQLPRPFRAPALPLAEVVDPTGAGDSFAGGFYGYIASQPELTPAVFRTAMFYGGVMGSFAVERFGTERLQDVTREEIDERFELFREISHLEHRGGLSRSAARLAERGAAGACRRRCCGVRRRDPDEVRPATRRGDVAGCAGGDCCWGSSR